MLPPCTPNWWALRSQSLSMWRLPLSSLAPLLTTVGGFQALVSKGQGVGEEGGRGRGQRP
jgi:hypothetical protein